jgi:predicted small metal-binding protein
MKEVSCGDFVPGCDARFSAESEEEVMAQAAEHARDAHGMTEMSHELAEQVRAKIRDVD